MLVWLFAFVSFDINTKFVYNLTDLGELDD